MVSAGAGTRIKASPKNTTRSTPVRFIDFSAASKAQALPCTSPNTPILKKRTHLRLPGFDVGLSGGPLFRAERRHRIDDGPVRLRHDAPRAEGIVRRLHPGVEPRGKLVVNAPVPLIADAVYALHGVEI